MKKERMILTSLLAVLILTNMQAQQITNSPKLVVGVTIDQLRSDYLEAFSALYGEKGFKRLLKEGLVYHDVEYSFNDVDRASAIAAIYSGTPPYYNGIVADNWLDRATLRVVNCVDDTKVIGYETLQSSSPRKLSVSTITDELKVSTNGRGLVFSFSPFREAAVFSAGHAADGAFWLDDDNGRWCGTSYYGNFPFWITSYNDQSKPDKRIKSIAWTPWADANDVTLQKNRNADFKYVFSDAKGKVRFKTSPLVNDEVNNIVGQCLQNTEIGADSISDFLSVNYYGGCFDHKSFSDSPEEMKDVYIRLDRDIAELLDLVDKKVGLKNTLFFVTSTGFNDQESINDIYRIPTGEFNIKRCTALLNMYLMAIYGDGQYVDAYHGNQIYLNHKLIEQKHLNLTEIMNRSSEFLIQVQGIKDVYTSRRLQFDACIPEISRIKNGYNTQISGDITLIINSGWKFVDPDKTEQPTVRNSFVEFPLIFFGANVKSDNYFQTVTTDYIAPTLAHCMRIRAPNACRVSPLAISRR